MELPGVLVIGRETASLLVDELHQRDLPAVWAFAASIRDLDAIHEQAGDKLFRPLVFENELPLPDIPDAPDAMRKYRRSVKAFAARMGRGALVETGYPDAELPQGDMRIRRNCYRSTKRWWNPVICTCLPLYQLGAGGVVVEPQVMAGAAKLIYMQAVAGL